jgi:hypothetical protein
MCLAIIVFAETPVRDEDDVAGLPVAMGAGRNGH